MYILSTSSGGDTPLIAVNLTDTLNEITSAAGQASSLLAIF